MACNRTTELHLYAPDKVVVQGAHEPGEKLHIRYDPTIGLIVRYETLEDPGTELIVGQVLG